MSWWHERAWYYYDAWSYSRAGWRRWYVRGPMQLTQSGADAEFAGMFDTMMPIPDALVRRFKAIDQRWVLDYQRET